MNPALLVYLPGVAAPFYFAAAPMAQTVHLLAAGWNPIHEGAAAHTTAHVSLCQQSWTVLRAYPVTLEIAFRRQLCAA